MYTGHFGLNELPFENVPDPKFFFDHGDHARVRTRIIESLKAGRGLSVVTGHIGSGKTTISQMIKSDLANSAKFIWMAEPPGNSIDLYVYLSQELGLKPSVIEKTFLLRDIREALANIISEGGKCIVIIDEAHLMSDDTVNGIRLLNNLEEGSTKLIQVLLLGQEELMDIINRPDMEPFKQRIATLEILGKMDAERIRSYISHRLHVAGGRSSIFTDTVWEAIITAFGSGSTPRIINSFCDQCLNKAFERKKTEVDVDDVYDVAQVMGLQKEVFFYMIALKERLGRKQDTDLHGNDGIKENTDSTGRSAEPAVKKPETTGTVQEKMRLESAALTQRGPGIAPSVSVEDKKSMTVPLIFLLLSIAALIFSIFFFCAKSGSTGPMACLLELIGL